jgi:hypothetical protein
MIATAMMSDGIHLRIWSPRAKPLDEMFDDILKHGCVQFVDDVLPIPLSEDQIRVLEYAQVARNGRPAGAELLGDLTGGTRSVA